MKEKEKNTIRIDSTEISSGVNNNNTVKVDSSTIKSFESNNTVKTDGSEIIKSGLSSTLKVIKDSPLVYQFNDIQYKLISKISDSSTEAEIYLIEKDGNNFVLKLYYPFVKPKFEIVERLKKLEHPDILTVLDTGYYEDRFFEILPFADQGSLLEAKPIKNFDTLKRIVLEIVEALNFCHTNGIIHRDIKPSNIFIKDPVKKDVLIGDFGISSLVQDGEELRRTSIFQTPIYAAPEYKISLSRETYITKAVDYYALGITVWELYSGNLPPGDMDDLEFLRLMFEGNPPLPEDINKHLENLIRGLTTRDYKKRWGFEEVQKWAKGESVEVYKETDHDSDLSKFEFGEDSNGDKVFASNPEELASLIYEYPDEGRKLLYRGLISEWLKTSNRKLFLEIADAIEYRFKENEKAGTVYSVYLLDKNFPYYSVDNKPLRKKNELIKELENNFDIYKDRLKNPSDKFYLYLRAKKAEKDVDNFQLLFEREDNESALHKIIFSLKLSLESRISYETEFNGTQIKVDNLRALSKILLDNLSLSNQLIGNIKFLIWLDITDNAIYQEYQKRVSGISKNEASRILPYVLSPDMGYIGIDGNECHSLQEFGEEFYKHFEKYIKVLKNSDSTIFDYFRFHGLTGEAEFFNLVFDSEKASSKPATYNDKIALYKIIKGTEYNCTIEIEGVQLSTPEELLIIEAKRSTKIRSALEDKNSDLFAWLSSFYHEFPLNDENNMYLYYRENYEERLKSFLELLRSFDPGNRYVKRYNKASNEIKSIKDKFSNVRSRIRLEVMSVYILPALLAILLFAYTIIFENINIPVNVFALGEWYFLSFALGFTIFYFWSSFNESDFSFSTGCIGGPIVGLIISVIAYYIFYLVIFVPLFLAIVLGVGYYFVYSQVKENSTLLYEAGENYRDSFNLGEMENIIFAYTFEKTNEININYSDELSELKSSIREARFNLWLFSAIYSSLIILILLLLLFNTPSIF
jgi:serine/threonine protein kinase